MRSFLLAAALAAAAAGSASAQTCSTANLAFITAATGPFTQQCAASVTVPTLTPFGMVVTQLLEPTQSTLAFLSSTYVTTRINGVINALASAPPPGGFGQNRTTLGWPTFPFSQSNPTVTNFSALTGGQTLNTTVLGAVAYILCPTLKAVVRDLIACVPSNCSGLVTGLCQNPTAENAVALMGSTYANTPFTTGTLAVLGAIQSLCAGARDAKTKGAGTLYAAASITEGDFNSTCDVVAPASLVGTFSYPATASPTRAGSAAEIGMGAVAAVATLAAAAFAF